MIVGHESCHQDTEDCPQGETRPEPDQGSYFLPLNIGVINHNALESLLTASSWHGIRNAFMA
jgi:hypothetical protein